MLTGKNVLVLGAGVSGLSTSILLREAGYAVTIWAKELPPHTTSDVAAAFWYPYLCQPRDKAVVWSKFTREYLKNHALGDNSSGCVVRTFTEMFETQVGEPWWKDAVVSYRRPLPDELPEGYVDGYQTDVVLMDSQKYMRWLVDQFTALGGQIHQKTVTTIDEAFDDCPIVINCTGLGSRELFGDESVYPVRGQIVVAKPNGYNTLFVVDSLTNGLTHITPRIDDLVIGGVSQPHNWNLEVDESDTAAILERARAFSPLFEDLDILDIRVGLRPARDEVRLEREDRERGSVIHNYGHGGAGYTLSWGCAQDVVKIVEQLVSGEE